MSGCSEQPADEPLIITGRANTAVYLTQADAQAKVRVQSRTKLEGGTARLVWSGDDSKMKIGDALQEITLASAPIGKDGTFTLRHTPEDAELAAMKAHGNWLNITVEVTSPTGAKGSWGTSRHWDGKTWASPDQPDKDAGTPLEIDVPTATG